MDFKGTAMSPLDTNHKDSPARTETNIVAHSQSILNRCDLKGVGNWVHSVVIKLFTSGKCGSVNFHILELDGSRT